MGPPRLDWLESFHSPINQSISVQCSFLQRGEFSRLSSCVPCRNGEGDKNGLATSSGHVPLPPPNFGAMEAVLSRGHEAQANLPIAVPPQEDSGWDPAARLRVMGTSYTG